MASCCKVNLHEMNFKQQQRVPNSRDIPQLNKEKIFQNNKKQVDN